MLERPIDGAGAHYRKCARIWVLSTGASAHGLCDARGPAGPHSSEILGQQDLTLCAKALFLLKSKKPTKHPKNHKALKSLQFQG